MPTDNINHPAHYNSHESGVECIEIVRYLPYSLGNAIKYIWRAGLKSENKLEDYKKAVWYLQDCQNCQKSDFSGFKANKFTNINLEKFIDNSVTSDYLSFLIEEIYQQSIDDVGLNLGSILNNIIFDLNNDIKELECQQPTS